MKLCRTLYTIIFVVALVKREALAKSTGPAERIYGGVVVPVGDAPFQVSFQINGQHFCGGSIIDPHFIVTAAHCCVAVTNSSGSLIIAAGLNKLSHPEQGFQPITVARMIVHPDYDEYVISADICMVQLNQSLLLSAERRTAEIKLPPSGYTASGDANVTGWGQTDDNTVPDALMRVTVPIVPDDLCRESHPPEDILDEMICAGAKGKGGCYGDSGGPLVDSKGFLVGVVSWVRGCGSEYPGVYTEVSYFTQWIKNHILVNSTYP